MKNSLLALSLLFLLAACATTRTKAPEKSFADRWDITVFGTPLGTVSGILEMVESEDGFKGTFISQGETYELRSAFEVDGKLNFVFYMPNYDIDVDVVLNGPANADTLEGISMGEYRTVAERVTTP